MARKRKPAEDWTVEEFGDVPAIEAVLSLLHCLYCEAAKMSATPWRFPARVGTLRCSGLPEESLRRLLERQVVVQHGEDVVLAEAGAAWVQRLGLPPCPYVAGLDEPVFRKVTVFT